MFVVCNDCSRVQRVLPLFITEIGMNEMFSFLFRGLAAVFVKVIVKSNTLCFARFKCEIYHIVKMYRLKAGVGPVTGGGKHL
jgi:hypothetical protein